ncbi:uncharacterized protein N7473_010526 [Penicillium subrubescens]|uniref:DUF676 domain-containing protein n=1 Tax=Penicillium subrubescens TaxID=1316194 RepID=A0A1Q5SZL7_9EURO|nr:uncharacterized protein N7473_010526 [Penicillium subrubescens]KAJ5883640.1 hypothetical protein N7473_010526 [Penicillium subrubescens]OKO93390.1 hypothetical protein PENSUB_12453 [Penicillium subrubescens]
MRKTLLLVFIHGFKGGDDTFTSFPEKLRTVVGKALPAINVTTAVYPKYETKGDLKGCVGRFRDWLQNTVIDLEVANHTASPTVDPSVHVFLVGHSMGGIVAAETLLLLASEQPIPANPTSKSQPAPQPEDDAPVVEPGTFMFPHIQGVLAFDTPFLGIAPGVVSYGAEGHYRNATTAYNTFTEVAGIFGYGKSSPGQAAAATAQEAPKALPPTADAAATPSWQRWGRYAMFAGAAGAVAAGGAAALYSQRQNLTAGFTWVSSHLEFVGCLARTSELKQRLEGLVKVQEDRGIECVNFYTCLGQGAGNIVAETATGKTSFSQKIIRSKNRTFCMLPSEVEDGEEMASSSRAGLQWKKAVNNQAADEVQAHVSMFLPKDNPAFFDLVGETCKTLVISIDKGWYNSATGPAEGSESLQQPASEVDFMDADDVVVVE